MNDFTISVVIPVYNLSSYIDRCIRSVMSQSYSAFECIIVDDASTDDSLDQCLRMIEAYRGPICFSILRHQQNRGLSAARNTGTDAAKGEYVLYLDGDDMITADCLEKLRQPLLADNSIDMVMGDYVLYDGSSQEGKHPRKHFCGDFPTQDAVRNCYYERGICEAAWNKLVRKSFLSRFNLTFREGIIWEDLLWSFYVMKHLEHIYLIKDVTYVKYNRPDSICFGTDHSSKLYYYGLVYDEITRNFTLGDHRREAKYYVSGFCKRYVFCPQNEMYKRIAHRFKRELSMIHDTRLYLKLLSVNVFSLTRLGRKLYALI